MIQNRLRELYVDLVSECKAAWGVNLLNVGHNNALMRLRRTSDNVEMNLYRQGIFLNSDRYAQFDPSLTSSYISALYDQIYPYSAALQTDTAKQPKFLLGYFPYSSTLYFDGSNDVIEAADHLKMQFPSSGYSVAVDFQTLSDTDNRYVLGKGVSPSVASPYFFYTSNAFGSAGSSLRFGFLNTSGEPYIVNSNVRIDDDKFHFAVGVRNRTESKLKLSLDGNAFSEVSDGGASDFQQGNLYIGKGFEPASLPVNALINSVMIFGKALTIDEIGLLNNLAVLYRE